MGLQKLGENGNKRLEYLLEYLFQFPYLHILGFHAQTQTTSHGSRTCLQDSERTGGKWIALSKFDALRRGPHQRLVKTLEMRLLYKNSLDDSNDS